MNTFPVAQPVGSVAAEQNPNRYRYPARNTGEPSTCWTGRATPAWASPKVPPNTCSSGPSRLLAGSYSARPVPSGVRLPGTSVPSEPASPVTQ